MLPDRAEWRLLEGPDRFRSDLTDFNIKQRELRSESGIAGEHVKNNQEVRRLLVDRGIIPESLPPAEDVKKVERRLQSQQRKLGQQTKRLEDSAGTDSEA